MQKDHHQENDHSSEQDQKGSGILLTNTNHKENGQKAGSKAREVENYQYTSAPMRERLKLFFRTIISVNQLSIYGAVSDLCEEYESYHD